MKKTRAGKLLKVAFATYRQGEKNIAKDIFVLAMDDPSAAEEFGAESKEDLESALSAAVAEGDFDAATNAIEKLRGLNGNGAAHAAEGDDLFGLDGDDLVPEGLGEGADSPGDVVQPAPSVDLAPAQVKALVALARKVNKGGHPDLARKITKAMGLP